MMDDEMFDSLLTDARIVRHGDKIASVRDNASFMLELREDGGIGKVIGGWPSEKYVALLEMPETRGSRFGGSTGAYALRYLGRDCYVLSRDDVARLIVEGVADKALTSKSAMKSAQEAFNAWMA